MTMLDNPPLSTQAILHLNKLNNNQEKDEIDHHGLFLQKAESYHLDKDVKLNGLKQDADDENGIEESSSSKEDDEEEQDLEEEEDKTEWQAPVSRFAKNCRNYIREIVDTVAEPNPNKTVIALSIGDPTVYGNLRPSPETTAAVIRVIEGGKHDGYAPSIGYESARAAIAEFSSRNGANYTAKDVVLCSGCSSSLDLCISVLANPGQNILMPRPGFPLYRTLAESLGIHVKMYDLLPEENWRADLYDLEANIDEQTAAIIVNNPSNPCGSVFDKEHIREILLIAQKHKVPIIADEIYEYLTFAGSDFTSMAALSRNVPILVCGGLAKRFLVPGWRLGWILVHDPIGAFNDVRRGLVALSQRTIGSCTVVQGAIPEILQNTPQDFHDDLIKLLQENARIAFDGLNAIRGLKAYMPQGAMYMMIRFQKEHFPQFIDGREFIAQMMKEESVFPLPGEAFFLPNFMRIVLTVPAELIEEAIQRISEFCDRYYQE